MWRSKEELMTPRRAAPLLAMGAKVKCTRAAGAQGAESVWDVGRRHTKGRYTAKDKCWSVLWGGKNSIRKSYRLEWAEVWKKKVKDKRKLILLFTLILFGARKIRMWPQFGATGVLCLRWPGAPQVHRADRCVTGHRGKAHPPSHPLHRFPPEGFSRQGENELWGR